MKVTCDPPTMVGTPCVADARGDLVAGRRGRRGRGDADEVGREQVVPVDGRELRAVDDHVVAGRLEAGADERQAEARQERVGPHVQVGGGGFDQADLHAGSLSRGTGSAGPPARGAAGPCGTSGAVVRGGSLDLLGTAAAGCLLLRERDPRARSPPKRDCSCSEYGKRRKGKSWTLPGGRRIRWERRGSGQLWRPMGRHQGAVSVPSLVAVQRPEPARRRPRAELAVPD